MSTTGIVLAAGEATRLPNKPLLPIEHRQIVIESALFFCDDHCDETLVVVNTDGIIEQLLIRRGWQDLTFIVQPKAYGVCDAFARAACCAAHDHIMVTFGDNVYPVEKISMPVTGASVRKSNNPELDECMSHLVKDQTTWVKRGSTTVDPWKLLGWVQLPKKVAVLGEVDQTLIEFLNDHSIQGIWSDKTCHDVGTVVSYLEYLTDFSFHHKQVGITHENDSDR